MHKFQPLQRQLYNAVASKIVAQFKDYDRFAVRKAIIEAYVRCGGDFTIPSENINKVEASLLQRGAGLLWREYLGNKIKLNASGENYELCKGMAFGVKPVSNGYSLMLASAATKPVNLSALEGYTLLSMSRAITTREARFRT
jgi:hypothetical protein